MFYDFFTDDQHKIFYIMSAWRFCMFEFWDLGFLKFIDSFDLQKMKVNVEV